MGTNAGWPEAFGFSVGGGRPVVISEVEEAGSAQQAGLQPGDVITELDGVKVQQWSLEEVVSRAQAASKVPPSLVVLSRVRQFRLPRGPEGGFGITLRGDCPVFIRSVDFHSPARQAGVRSGDLLLNVNGEGVRYASKIDILDLLKRSGNTLEIMVVAGGLDWNLLTLPPSASSQQHRSNAKYRKAAEFNNKVKYYLLDDASKKSHLQTLLRLYARDRSVDSLASSLDVLLEGPIERRLLPYIRDYLHPQHRARFDAILSTTLAAGHTPLGTTSPRRRSVDTPRLLGATRGASWTSSMPTLSVREGRERLVRVVRGSAGFGFSLSGNAPVFIRSVDPAGAAAAAGLRPGDRLLSLNGLNIRNATHSHVVRLLRGSGTCPTLLISSPQLGEREGTSTRRGSASSLRAVDIRRQSSAFKQKMEEVLRVHEKEQVIQELGLFSQQKDISRLVEGLHAVLGDPTKMILFHYICQLLPEEAQAEFDRVAAARLAGEEPLAASSGATESDQDMLYRVQAERLLPEGVTRSIPTSHFHPPRSSVPTAAESVLEDTAIGQVGVARWRSREHGGGGGGTLDVLGEEEEEVEEEGEGEARAGREVREKMIPEQREALRVKQESLEKTAVGQSLTALLTGGPTTPQRRHSSETTPMATPTAVEANTTTVSTPGTVPPPPPTPEIGPGGVPIPPPPPPSLSTSSQSHLKRVNWKKMPRTEGTVWGELSGLEEAIELAELDQQFAVQNTKGSGPVKNKKPTVLDAKKAYNISILLGHLKLPINAIKEAVLSCDDSVLGEQHLRQMEAYAPDKKECLGFARYYDNPSILSLPDRFSCEMSTIPCYRERLHALVFRMHYQEKLEEIKPDLEAICLASVQLQRSKHFKKLLELVLAIGNHMNMGNIRIGQAQGFHISFLGQLHGLRTTDGRSSLLHYLAGLTERKLPQVLEFSGDLAFCSKAARVSGQTLEVEVNELSQGLRDIRRDIREINSRDRLPGDCFEEVMLEFLSTAEGQMADLLKLYSRMKQEYSQAVRFFGEDPVKTRIDDFFGIFASFIADFEKAVQENRQARQERALQEKRLKEQSGTGKRRSQASSKAKLGQRNEFDEFKKELERQRLRPTSRPQAQTDQGPPSDFRHLLRPHKEKARKQPGPASPSSPTSLPPPLEFDNETRF